VHFTPEALFDVGRAEVHQEIEWNAAGRSWLVVGMTGWS
jgi:hypothetical protein